MIHGTTVSNVYNKYCNLPKVTGVTSNANVVSIVGKDLSLDTRDKITESLAKNNLKFNNLDRTGMQISMTVNSEDVYPTMNCLHDLFFKK